MKKIQSARAPAAIGPYSQATGLGNLIFTSGQIPLSPETGEVVGTGITEQTEQVLANLGAVLEEGGSNFSLVLKTTCFLSDMANFAAFNEVYAKYFSEKPARSTVAVKALPRNVLVEVEAIAALPE
ncbi:MAG: RidA family protein [Treponema sp.]|jgi:2-iminobutanoate/2-iminopropanoate deaminase|nr:RidA family protein [Treponema sp.]